MITICVNHVTWLLEKAGYNESRFPTLTHYGYSSAAEIFIFMSGCMVGMVYLNKPKVNKKLCSRAIYLYLSNIGLFTLLAIIGMFFSLNLLSEQTQLITLYAHPVDSLKNFLTLKYCPLFTELLYLYFLLLLMSIPFTYIL
ncbi:OpgC domain-containing protein [Alteromonas naphthalenivorans]|uniref:Uncharacterized protein n=1 Tax=Alteromonas naphthalenivorans TaxID=715451 RepID=F5ZBH1_ALTNA|nr:hypothetical protein ambt_10520 [Alteromonas naphthalenivorans]